MSEQQKIDSLNENSLEFVTMLGGHITALDVPGKSCTMEFDVGTQFCHSIDVVQGGFVTAMLDMAMSHCVFGTDETIVNVSSLEIKTTYLEPTRAGHMRCVGTIIKAGYKVAFMEGRLYNSEGLLTATASSVGKLVRAKN
ncbi:MAG: hypothetical protein ACJAUG_002532 [Halioglobus sp.]|jgi:uncharacterized protein (TIGR00369 family)